MYLLSLANMADKGLRGGGRWRKKASRIRWLLDGPKRGIWYGSVHLLPVPRVAWPKDAEEIGQRRVRFGSRNEVPWNNANKRTFTTLADLRSQPSSPSPTTFSLVLNRHHHTVSPSH